MSAPHLPPKISEEEINRTSPSLSWVFFFIFVAALTSVALTLATVVWFVPSFFPEQTANSIVKSVRPPEENLDPAIVRALRQRVWNVYDSRDKIDNNFYRKDTKPMSAVMFSTDGWAVMYDPNYRLGVEKNWEGYDYQGYQYEIEKVIYDPVSKFVYLKFVGDGFSFVSFYNWDNLESGALVWLYKNGDWSPSVLENTVSLSQTKSENIWKPNFFYNLSEDLEEGTIAVSAEGDLVGVSNKEKKLIPGWLVENQYAQILENGKTLYTVLPWQGYMVDGFVNKNDLPQRVNGFYVSYSNTKNSSTTVGVGDVITKIQKESIIVENLSRKILFAPQNIMVTVLRDGEELDIAVEKIELK